MKFFLPKRGKYVLTDSFWYCNPSPTMTVKAICLGWNANVTLGEMIEPNGDIKNRGAEIEIPSGTIINITGYSLSPHKNVIKFSMPKKENKHLSVKLDYEAIIKSVAPKASTNRDFSYIIRQISVFNMTQWSEYSDLNGLECEEYNP